ncbi:hypothetical protein TWF192_011211 [Orbilia oligospora]|nr:hypothetical protein TWF192_011211 [Orbilia oligospora]
MHPKNVYKNGVNFAQLAKESPGFEKCLKGSTSINFHDPESIRQLAKALLKKEFNLEVDLPEDRLCPGWHRRLSNIPSARLRPISDMAVLRHRNRFKIAFLSSQ